MSRRFGFVFACVLGASLAACSSPAGSPSAAPADVSADIAAINTLRSSYAAAMQAGDVAKLTSLYAPDAVVMPENEPALTTPAAIRANIEKRFGAYAPMLSLTSDELRIAGDWAFDRGQFELMLHPKDAKNPQTPLIVENGKYVVILQRQPDKSWKVAREIGNSNAPMAMPVPAPNPAPKTK